MDMAVDMLLDEVLVDMKSSRTASTSEGSENLSVCIRQPGKEYTQPTGIPPCLMYAVQLTRFEHGSISYEAHT